MREFSKLVNDNDDAAASISKMNPKTNAEFEKYAKTIFDQFCVPHADVKQFKFFVKSLAKMLCEKLDKDAVKDVEAAVCVVRSQKVKAERDAAAAAKKGVLPSTTSSLH
jgi:hypothetical protein